MEKLIVTVTDAERDVMFHCSSDALFDILYETHLSIRHSGSDTMIKELNSHYKNITQNYIKIFLNASEHCQQKRKMGNNALLLNPRYFHMSGSCLLYTSRCV